MGVNTIKYLKEAKRYSLKIWGINAQDSNTPLLSLEFETHSFCAKEITIVTILVLIVIIVGIMGENTFILSDLMNTYDLQYLGHYLFFEVKHTYFVLHVLRTSTMRFDEIQSA